jgi:hypothetical protein
VPSQASLPIAFPQSICTDPLHRGVTIPFRERFYPLGTSIEVQSNREVVLEAARLSFSRYNRSLQTPPSQFLIQLCIDPERHDEEPRPIPSYRALSHLFHIGCGETSFAIADLAKGCAVGFVSPEIARDTSFFRYVFLECLFHVLVVHRSHTPVHCSTVALDGHGALICGPSGAGKTTLAYACAQSGMQIVSDDVVHLQMNPANNQVTLWGNPWTLRLLPDAVELFPELTGAEVKHRSDNERYLEVDVPLRLSGKALASCRPKVLVFLERGRGARTQLRPLAKETVLNRLYQDLILDEASVIERHRKVLQQLATLEAYELTYSGAPSVAVELIRGLLQQDP